MEQYFFINKKRWDELAAIHKLSSYYSVEKFKKGNTSLMNIELSELKDLSGKKLLHLMCHIGLDTLSLAREGAITTGIDFSEKSISIAKEISQELKIKGNFICCNVYDANKVISENYDIIFSSYGILCWLPSLEEWAKIIHSLLKDGGYFYLVDFHPFSDMLETNPITNKLEISYSYFNRGNPYRIIREKSYAEKNTELINKVLYRWPHSLDELVNSLTKAGLYLEFLHEFPYCSYDRFPGMKQMNNGYWSFEDKNINIPMMFSLKALKK